jgi:hypothetical protein
VRGIGRASAGEERGGRTRFAHGILRGVVRLHEIREQPERQAEAVERLRLALALLVLHVDVLGQLGVARALDLGAAAVLPSLAHIQRLIAVRCDKCHRERQRTIAPK